MSCVKLRIAGIALVTGTHVEGTQASELGWNVGRWEAQTWGAECPRPLLFLQGSGLDSRHQSVRHPPAHVYRAPAWTTRSAGLLGELPGDLVQSVLMPTGGRVRITGVLGRVAQPQVDGCEGHVQTISCPLVAITKNHGLGSLEQKWISLFEGSREGPSCASLLGGGQQTCVSLGLFTCHLPKLCPHGHITLSSVPSPFSSLTVKTPVGFRAHPDPRRLIFSAKTPLAT